MEDLYVFFYIGWHLSRILQHNCFMKARVPVLRRSIVSTILCIAS